MAITSHDGLARRTGLALLAAVPVAGVVAAVRHAEQGGGTPNLLLRDERSWIAHLFRRAGFGASPAEIDAAVARGFDATLDQLLNPTDDHDAAEYNLN